MFKQNLNHKTYFEDDQTFLVSSLIPNFTPCKVFGSTIILNTNPVILISYDYLISEWIFFNNKLIPDFVKNEIFTILKLGINKKDMFNRVLEIKKLFLESRKISDFVITKDKFSYLIMGKKLIKTRKASLRMYKYDNLDIETYNKVVLSFLSEFINENI